MGAKSTFIKCNETNEKISLAFLNQIKGRSLWNLSLEGYGQHPQHHANTMVDITTNIIFNIIVNIIMDGIHPQTSTFHPLYIHNVIKSLHKNIHILKHLELV